MDIMNTNNKKKVDFNGDSTVKSLLAQSFKLVTFRTRSFSIWSRTFRIWVFSYFHGLTQSGPIQVVYMLLQWSLALVFNSSIWSFQAGSAELFTMKMHVCWIIFHKSLHHINLLTALSFRIKCYSDSPLRNSSNVVTEKPKVFWIIGGMLQIDSFRETDSSFHIGCFHFEDFCQRETHFMAWKTAIRKPSGLSFWNVFSAKSWKLDVVMKFADWTNRQRSMSWLITSPQLRDPKFMVQGMVRLKSSA